MNTRMFFLMLLMVAGVSVYADDSRMFVGKPVEGELTGYPARTDADLVSMVVDDGTLETAVGIGGGQWLWLNRFTPNPGAFPIELNSIEVYWWSLYGPVVGASFDIYIYEDTDGDNDPGTGAAWLATYNATVQVVDAFSVYSIPPVTLNGPGDVLIAVVNRAVGIGASDFPAAFDQTATQMRSWAGIYSTDPPDPPTFPADALWGLIDLFGLPGNWMVRAYGEGGAIDPCMDFTSFFACCNRAGLVQTQVTLLNNTSHTGETVIFSIDGDPYTAVIEDNGTHSRARIAAGGYAAGEHTVSLGDPAGCFDPVIVNCASRLAKGEIEWEALETEWRESTKGAVAREIPAATTLLGNYPNPFNPTTAISYQLSADNWVALRIYNTLGEEVATLVNEFQTAGYKSATWNGRNDAGSSVASGIYIYRLTTGNVVTSEKMMFMK